MHSEKNNAFDASLLEKRLSTPFKYVVSVYIAGPEAAYCLTKYDENNGWEILLTKISDNMDEFNEEVKNIRKYFNA